MSGAAAATFLTILVFLIVFFVAWGLHIRAVSALALASVIALFFMYLAYPPIAMISNLRDTIGSPGWVTLYWILHILFAFYIFVYVIYMAIYDSMWGNRGQDKCPNDEFAKQIKKRDRYYDEIEDALSKKEDVIVNRDVGLVDDD